MVIQPLVVVLLLAAGLMHATWNALLKADRSDRLATFGPEQGDRLVEKRTWKHGPVDLV